MEKIILIMVVVIMFATSAFAQEDKTYKVGDFVQELGGIVFYIDSTGNHGLVCPDIDQGRFIRWGCYYDKEISGANGLSLYDGKQNTQDILAGCSKANIAAKVCHELVLYGKDDWYLPSKGELKLMYENLHTKGIGNFENGKYWSSTEFLENRAWDRNFSNGMWGGSKKDSMEKVRAVRAF